MTAMSARFVENGTASDAVELFVLDGRDAGCVVPTHVKGCDRESVWRLRQDVRDSLATSLNEQRT